jgi:hypothetical protein
MLVAIQTDDDPAGMDSVCGAASPLARLGVAEFRPTRTVRPLRILGVESVTVTEPPL